MVDPPIKRERYLSDVEGAPPLPPPGGYRGARREGKNPAWGSKPGTASSAGVAGSGAVGSEAASRTPLASVAAAAGAGSPAAGSAGTDIPGHGVPRDWTSPLGWIACGAVVAFALAMMGIVEVADLGALFGASMLAFQFVIVAIIVAALVSPRGRRLGAIALVVALVFNIGTVGAVAALDAGEPIPSSAGTESGFDAGYPGIKDVAGEEALNYPSLEEVRKDTAAESRAIRRALSKRFDYTWTPGADEHVAPLRNEFGGESMLSEFRSAVWASNEPVQSNSRKRAIIAVIESEVGAILSPLNDPSLGLDPVLLKKLYGSEDPEEQHTWVWSGYTGSQPAVLYVTFYDLSKDSTGDFRKERRARSAQTGEPLEGVQIAFADGPLLSKADRAEYQERIAEYPEQGSEDPSTSDH